MKKISSIILRISITLGLLIFLFSKTDFKALLAVFRHSDPSLIFFAFLFFFLLNILCLLRWHILLKGLAIKIPLGRLFVSYLSSQFFNLLLPSTIGGDAVRTMDIANYTKTHSSAILATVVLDRVAGFFGLMTVLVFALFFGYNILQEPGILGVALLLLLVVLFLAGIMFSGRFFHVFFRFLPFKNLKEYMYKIHGATSSYRRKKNILCAAWLFSVLIQVGLPLMYYMTAYAIKAKASLISFLILVPMITAFAVIPISIGGLGVRDTACVILFARAGLAKESALALSLANFGFMLLLGLCGAASYVFTLYRRRI